MSRLLLLFVSLFVGLLSGAGGAVLLGDTASQPMPTAARDEATGSSKPGDAAGVGSTSPGGEVLGDGAAESFVPLGRQLIVPVVRGRNTKALILFDLALDLPEALTTSANALAPRLRNAFLQDLMDLSHTGAFDDTYTDGRVMEEIRRRLLGSARSIIGDGVRAVLILDVLRQEL